MKPSRDIDDLLAIMAALRAPIGGCPWDREQTFATIAPYTIEEAHEVTDAIARGDVDDLRDELGDLLFQVVFHARMAEEAGQFAFPDVVEAITAKMIRRHPHVFGDAEARSARLAKDQWERIKAEEKAARRARRIERGEPEEAPSVLDGVPGSLPGLARAVKLQQKAATVGFDWNDPRAVLAKIREETDEVEAELGDAAAGSAHDRIEDEIGDLLFAVANLARHVAVDPDAALRRANEKFRRRFGHIERRLAEQGIAPTEAGLEAMETLWQEAKAG